MTTTTGAPTKETLKLERQQIDIEVRRADLLLKQSELKKAAAEAISAELSAERNEFGLQAHRREEKGRLALEAQATVYDFADEVDELSVSIFVDWLHNRRFRFPNKDLTVYLNSPGGSVYAGFVAMDAIREVQDAGNPVTVKITGMAASMAGIIAQAANTRLIGKSSELMIHTVASFQFGNYKTFQVADQDEYLRRLTKKSLSAYADRSSKWTAEELFIKVHEGRKDWWLSAQEALEQEFVDGTF